MLSIILLYFFLGRMNCSDLIVLYQVVRLQCAPCRGPTIEMRGAFGWLSLSILSRIRNRIVGQGLARKLLVNIIHRGRWFFCNPGFLWRKVGLFRVSLRSYGRPSSCGVAVSRSRLLAVFRVHSKHPVPLNFPISLPFPFSTAYPAL